MIGSVHDTFNVFIFSMNSTFPHDSSFPILHHGFLIFMFDISLSIHIIRIFPYVYDDPIMNFGSDFAFHGAMMLRMREICWALIPLRPSPKR